MRTAKVTGALIQNDLVDTPVDSFIGDGKEAKLDFDFEEIVVPLFESDFHEQLKRYSESALAPVYIDNDVTAWDSLAIAEYLAKKHPQTMAKGSQPASPRKINLRRDAQRIHDASQRLTHELPRAESNASPKRCPGSTSTTHRYDLVAVPYSIH